MPRVIQTFSSRPATIQTVELGGTLYRLRLHWQERNQSWYCDLYEIDEAPIFQGRRLSPLYGPGVGITRAEVPGGQLLVQGPDPYLQAELGGRVTLFFATNDELAALAGESTPSTPVVTL